VSSASAIEEAKAQRNLAINRPEALQRLTRLTVALSTVDTARPLTLPKNLRLDPKDQPILMAAIHRKTDYLLTGDARHFEHLYGKRTEGKLLAAVWSVATRRRPFVPHLSPIPAMAWAVTNNT
jgi:hypothetical protein